MVVPHDRSREPATFDRSATAQCLGFHRNFTEQYLDAPIAFQPFPEQFFAHFEEVLRIGNKQQSQQRPKLEGSVLTIPHLGNFELHQGFSSCVFNQLNSLILSYLTQCQGPPELINCAEDIHCRFLQNDYRLFCEVQACIQRNST